MIEPLMIPPKLAVINDIAGYGRCALSVAIPIISAMKVQACPVPTSCFSNHMGFPAYFAKDLSDSLTDYLALWDALGLTFDGIYCGYLNDQKQAEIFAEFMHNQKKQTTNQCKIIIDPIMGDHGVPYKSVTQDYCNMMKKFIAGADILTPNLTEACMLTDTPYHTRFSQEELCTLASKLKEQGIEKIVITGIPNTSTSDNAMIGNFIYENESSYHLLQNEVCGKSRPGTGDMFASIISASAVQGKDFTSSVKKAADFISLCIKASHTLQMPVEQGVCFELFLDKLNNDF